MKAQNITVDINKMNEEQLKMLSEFFFHDEKDASACKKIQDRIAYLKGWMSEKQSKEYYSKYCA